MTNIPPHSEKISSRTTVRLLAPNTSSAPILNQGVLSDEDEQPVGPFTEFVAADTPFELDLDAAPPAPESTPVAVVDHTVTREEEREFSYALLHEVYTPDGVVYEVSLPIQPDLGVLGDEDDNIATPTLRFPIKHFMEGPPQQGVRPMPDSGVLGDDDTFLDRVGAPFQHIVRIVRAPINGAIDAIVAHTEAKPTPLRVADDGTLQPLASAEAWRGLFDAPSREQRVLLYIHGFLSDSDASLPRMWLPWLRDRYDAIIAYTHPTLSRDPLTNVTDLLKRVPADLQMNIDLVAHSRGGLVARSLVELATQIPQINVEKLMTCGSPHNGTPLANHQQWDKLVSIGMTATSWMMTAAGAPFTARLVPKLIEQVLKAGSKHFFELPGVNALVPDNPFLRKLNAVNTPSVMADSRYAVVVSSFDSDSILQAGFKQALQSLVAQSFINASNDLIVPTDSMSAIDAATMPFGGKQHAARVNHFGYFDDNAIAAFAGEFLQGR